MPHTSERRVASRCSVSLPCAALRYLLLRAFASLIADDKYLGIHGSHYVHKIVAQEGMTMVLQTPYKLPTLARAATMAATHPSLAVFDPWFERFYWLMLFALVFNAVFPGVLLRCKSERLQRHAVAACDAALGVLYFLITFVASCATGCPGWHLYALRVPGDVIPAHARVCRHRRGRHSDARHGP